MALLGDVALMKLMWSCWRNGAAVGIGFEVSDAQVRPSVAFISAACKSRCRTLHSSITMSDPFLHSSCQDNNSLIDIPLYTYIYDYFKLIGTKSSIVTKKLSLKWGQGRILADRDTRDSISASKLQHCHPL